MSVTTSPSPSPRAVRLARLLESGPIRGLGALFFPSPCLLCRSSLEDPLHGPVCAMCLESLPVLPDPRLGSCCPRCGLVYDASVVPGLCGPCRSPLRSFRTARSLYAFTDPVRACVHALKYRGRPRLGRILGARAGRMWLERGAEGLARDANELVVAPVPLSRKRRRARGYNQSAVIARAVASTAGLPLVEDALVRVRERPPQAGLTASQRRRNVAGVFRAKRAAALSGRAVLLVDDVLTTGATADAASRSLLRSGASAVDVLTLARVF